VDAKNGGTEWLEQLHCSTLDFAFADGLSECATGRAVEEAYG